MIRKYLLGFIVGFVGLLSFSYGVEIGGDGDFSHELPGNFYLGSTMNTIGKDLNFSNSDGGNRLFDKSYGCSVSVFWVSGRLYDYFYCGDYNYQGYFSKACKVFSLSGGLELPLNCEEETEIALEEFYNLTGYNFTRYYNSDFHGVALCFYNDNNNYYYCFKQDYLTGNLGIVGNEIDFSQYAGGSPFGDGFDPLSPGIANNVDLSGNLLYSDKCTNGYIVAKLHDLYGSDGLNICYAGSFDSSLVSGTGNYQFTYNTGYTLKEVFENTSNGSYGYFNNYSDWYNSWSDSIYKYKIGQIGGNPFSGTPVYLYTYFNNLYNNGRIYPRSNNAFFILNYCNLALYSDYNQIYQGSYFQEYCDMIPGGRVNSGVDNLSGDSLGTVVGVSRNGVLSGADEDFDGTNFINEFYQKLSGKFERPVGSLFGIIPNYILVFMFALILFRFLQH